MSSDAEGSIPCLLFRAGKHLCALELSHITEIMRPLPVERISGAPEAVRGLAIIRGAPAPVLDLGYLMGSSGKPPERFVVVRTGERRVALAVEEVLGTEMLDPSTLSGVPRLIDGPTGEGVRAIGVLDSQLLLVLQSASLVPEEIWRTLPNYKP